MLRQVLLGNTDDFDGVARARVSSISGRPVLQKGMGLVIGDESSSEEEEEEEKEEEEEEEEEEEDASGKLQPLVMLIHH